MVDSSATTGRAAARAAATSPETLSQEETSGVVLKGIISAQLSTRRVPSYGEFALSAYTYNVASKRLFDPDTLDQLEGLNERYALLTRRAEALQDDAASFDRPPDLTQLNTFEALRRKVKQEAADLLKGLLEDL